MTYNWSDLQDYITNGPSSVINGIGRCGPPVRSDIVDCFRRRWNDTTADETTRCMAKAAATDCMEMTATTFYGGDCDDYLTAATGMTR